LVYLNVSRAMMVGVIPPREKRVGREGRRKGKKKGEEEEEEEEGRVANVLPTMAPT
jgi:hypothetical protein